MEIRFLALESIISDDLMPWLDENNHSRKYVLILNRFKGIAPYNTALFFKLLLAINDEMKLPLKASVIGEWKSFSLRNPDQRPRFFLEAFRSEMPEPPKIVFYSLLIAMSINAYSSLFEEYMNNPYHQSLRVFIIHKTHHYGNDILERILMMKTINHDDLIILTRLYLSLHAFLTKMGDFYTTQDSSWINHPVYAFDQTTSIFRSIKEELEAQISQLAPHKPDRKASASKHYESPEGITESFQLLNDLIYRQNQFSPEMNKEKSDNGSKLKELKDTEDKLKDVKGTIPEMIKKGAVSEAEGTAEQSIKSAEVLKMLGITKGTLHNMIKRGQIQSTKVGGQYRFSRNEVVELMKVRKG